MMEYYTFLSHTSEQLEPFQGQCFEKAVPASGRGGESTKEIHEVVVSDPMMLYRRNEKALNIIIQTWYYVCSIPPKM